MFILVKAQTIICYIEKTVEYCILELLLIIQKRNMIRMRRLTSSSNVLETEISNLQNRVLKLETVVASLKNLLDVSRTREKKLANALKGHGDVINLDIELGNNESLEIESDISIHFDTSALIWNLIERGGWLIRLLIFQSFSSFILASYDGLLGRHPVIIYYLTMLVGAGGNAGNQAAVRVIRGIAVGQLNSSTYYQFIIKELGASVALSTLLGLFGFFRVIISAQASFLETISITIALMIVVFVSIILGTLLPIFLEMIRIDPAHSSTSIQVIMDILGVIVTCSVATFLLDTLVGQQILKPLVS